MAKLVIEIDVPDTTTKDDISNKLEMYGLEVLAGEYEEAKVSLNGTPVNNQAA